ncbi:MAG TPA: hypothetical protein VMB20_10540 [Candidatus Acidoferrum sp.]|nr:hypothetical protein [Candidatus Acidoferrum sp.]
MSEIREHRFLGTGRTLCPTHFDEPRLVHWDPIGRYRSFDGTAVGSRATTAGATDA